jgi:hypothetical protein
MPHLLAFFFVLYVGAVVMSSDKVFRPHVVLRAPILGQHDVQSVRVTARIIYRKAGLCVH